MKTTKTIELLNGMIRQAENRHSAKIEEYKAKLKNHWVAIFENDKQLEKDAKNAQTASEYGADEVGIYSWFRVKTNLADYSECKEYLEDYLHDQYCLGIDWENECFIQYLGDDCLIIQDDTRHDNGVWQGHKCIIDEDLYKNEDGEIDTEKRNQLIEKHMEKTGCFPGVFRIDSYGNVFHVSTKKKN